MGGKEHPKGVDFNGVQVEGGPKAGEDRGNVRKQWGRVVSVKQQVLDCGSRKIAHSLPAHRAATGEEPRTCLLYTYPSPRDHG